MNRATFWFWISGGIFLATLCGGLALSTFNLSAMPGAGPLESYIARRAKHILIWRGSQSGNPAAPASLDAGNVMGEMDYGVDCAMCHGSSGNNATEQGRWMSPRAADLTSPEVQQYSDAELFWIVKNGLRFTGMPAFGQVENEEHIWNIVHFVRTLGAPGRRLAGAGGTAN